MFVATKALAVVVPKITEMLEAMMPPPVIVKPLEDESPAVDTPPAKVEDEVLVTAIFVAVVEASCERPVTAREVEVASVNMAEVARKMVAKRLVEVELVNVPLFALKSEAKNEVEVEFVVVELSAVKFWRVEDPVVTRFGVVRRPVESMVVVAVPPA
jgi:hypothetical protein